MLTQQIAGGRDANSPKLIAMCCLGSEGPLYDYMSMSLSAGDIPLHQVKELAKSLYLDEDNKAIKEEIETLANDSSQKSETIAFCNAWLSEYNRIHSNNADVNRATLVGDEFAYIMSKYDSGYYDNDDDAEYEIQVSMEAQGFDYAKTIDVLNALC